MSGKVVHFEVPATNLKRAQSFYKDVFGWQMNDVNMADGTYTMVGTAPTDENGRLTEPGAINGGMMKKRKPFTGPIVTLQVDEMDEALKAVVKHGGEDRDEEDCDGPIRLLRILQGQRRQLDGALSGPAEVEVDSPAFRPRKKTSTMPDSVAAFA